MSEASRRIPRPSHNYVPEYQQSGVPWVKNFIIPAAANAAALKANIANYKISFDSVTRWVKLHCHDDGADKVGVFIYFNETAAKTAYDGAGQDQHYYLMDLEEVTERLELKCKYMYLIPDTATKSAHVAIIAGLTNVSSDDFPEQTKDNGFLGLED